MRTGFAAESWNWISSSASTAYVDAVLAVHSEHGVDICLLKQTHLQSVHPFRLANYICYRTDHQARGGGTEILVHRGIDHCAVPVLGLQHLEPSSIHLVLASRPVKIVAGYLSPTRPLVNSDFTACLSGGLPVLMSCDLNAEARGL
jgi:hypothetical protein